MRTHTLTLRSATTAIAAVLALGSTPLLAQAVSPTGDPVIVAPVPAAPAAPVAAAPAAPVAPTTTAAPVVQSLPSTYVPATAAAPEAVPSAAPSRAAAAAPARPVARAAAPAPAAAVPAPATTTVTANDTAPIAAPAEQAAAPTDTELFPASQTANEPVVTPAPAANAVDDFTVVTGVVGGLTILALGWLGFAVTRRRKARRAEAVPQQVTRPVVTPRPEPVIVTRAATATAPQALPETAVSEPSPVMADPQAIPAAAQPQPIRANMDAVPAVARAENSFGAGHARWADDHRPRSAQAPIKGMLASNGASVDLPARIPESFEERDALLKRMIAAKPDKANPYTDRRARMKRARLILQSLGRDFGNAEPWIDLSQYPNNWPELANRRYPQAA